MSPQVHPHADAAAAAEAALSAALQRVFASDQARDLTGLASIHQLADARGLPGWLLWCNGRPGAYQLEMVDTASAPLLGAEAVLALRYFPSPEEPAMAEFTEQERELRLSPAFDHTGTPIFGALELGDTDLFILGRLTLRLDGVGQPYQLTWDAPADGEAVPAWDLGLPLVDGLVAALCLAQGRGPAAACALRRSDGVGQPPPGWARLWVGLAGSSGLPIAEAGLRVLAHASDEHQAQPPLNPEWWRIGRRHFHDADQQSMCCCHEH
ncbi:MAG: hypothetical protein KKB57_13895 [Proteobacteria bacterium]|nr:hypothetical protein [Pseudomonadota bacterium]MBU2518672.1 hypothetical protein [Pseudomonadota bacterium]